jgi:hypothetical protein
MSEYLVLYSSPSGNWESLGLVDARSTAEAIRMRIQKDDNALAGTYVAVPARSWRPVTVTAETQTVIRLKAQS